MTPVKEWPREVCVFFYELWEEETFAIMLFLWFLILLALAAFGGIVLLTVLFTKIMLIILGSLFLVVGSTVLFVQLGKKYSPEK